MLSNEFRGSIIRFLVGAVGAVFLGAVGSGLWERFLAPVTDGVVRALVAGTGRMSRRYVDHLYSDVGAGLHEYASKFPAALIMLSAVAISLVGIAFIVLARKKTVPPSPSLPTARKRFLDNRLIRSTCLAVAIFNVVAYSDELFALRYQYKTVIWIERSLEIIRPGIEERRYFELRAVYRSVEDARTFFIFWDALTHSATNTKVVLPKFSPIGSP